MTSLCLFVGGISTSGTLNEELAIKSLHAGHSNHDFSFIKPHEVENSNSVATNVLHYLSPPSTTISSIFPLLLSLLFRRNPNPYHGATEATVFRVVLIKLREPHSQLLPVDDRSDFRIDLDGLDIRADGEEKKVHRDDRLRVQAISANP